MILGALAFTWVAAAYGLDRYGQRPAQGRYDAIVVLGCRVRPDGSPSPSLRRRATLGAQLWHRGLAPRLVLTGGVGHHPPSEASAAAQVAEALGVPRSAMILEERSTSTEENATEAARLTDARRVLLVTDAYHVFRAERVFRRHFATAHGTGSLGSRSVRIRGSVREVGALLAYALVGRL